jgi:copper resistance protein C
MQTQPFNLPISTQRRAVVLGIGYAIALAEVTSSFSAALAHAALHHASPTAGSTLSTAPTEVSLWFTDNLEGAFSSVEVTDSGGGRVDQGNAQVSGNAMRVGVKALSPGSYRVDWRAVSVDTPKSEGDFTFQVGGQ